MTTSKPTTSLGAPAAHQPLSPAETIEEDASLAAVAAGDALHGVEVAAVVLLGLVVCPPLAILAVVFVGPVLVTALVLGLLGAVLSTPYVLVHHFRGHHPNHLSLLRQRLRRAGRALIDLAPHRIAADARRPGSGAQSPLS